MRALKWNAIILAIGLAFAGRLAATQHQAIDMKSMSVAELQKAGDLCQVQKDYNRAIEYFQEAVRKEKKNATLRNKLGLAELQAGNTEQARVDFEKASKLKPKSADAVNNLGAVYYMQNKLGPAAKYFKQAVALDETRAAFHVNLGAAWFGQKKFDRAIHEYARALELDPQALESRSRVGVTAQIAHPEDIAKYNYMLAKIYAKHGDADSCLRCLTRAKEHGYRDLANVYKEEEFSKLWTDARLAELVPPPTTR